jgi:hypothetical protein
MFEAGSMGDRGGCGQPLSSTAGAIPLCWGTVLYRAVRCTIQDQKHAFPRRRARDARQRGGGGTLCSRSSFSTDLLLSNPVANAATSCISTWSTHRVFRNKFEQHKEPGQLALATTCTVG